MIVIACPIAGIAIGDAVRGPAEDVPDAWAASVKFGSALDLVTRRRDAPDEVSRQWLVGGDVRGERCFLGDQELARHDDSPVAPFMA
jgi:hypothetical protein